MVTGHARQFTANYGECCSSVAPGGSSSSLRLHHEIATAATSSAPLQATAAGRKIGHFNKKHWEE